jgi:hypothetical protein
MDHRPRAEMAERMPPFVGDRSASSRPTCRRCSPGGGSRRRSPQYLDASARLARYEARPTRGSREHPVALCPCAPDVAPPLRGRVAGGVGRRADEPGGKLTLATYASALGLPAVCVPVMRARRAGCPSAFS